MNALTYPLRNLREHPMRSLLTAVGIGAALASLLGLVGFSRGVDRGVTLSMQDRGTDIVAIKRGSIEVLMASIDENLAARLRTVPGVVNVIGSMGELLEMESGQMAYMSGWTTEGGFWDSLNIVAGRKPNPAESSSVVLGQGLAEILNKRPGDQIELSGQLFHIVAISRQASVIDDRSVIMPLATLQRLLDREGKVSGFHLRIDHPEDPGRVAEVKRRLAAAFPELTFVESAEMAHYGHITRLLHAMAWASSTIALVMAFVIVLNTLLMAVTERMREIGVLAAIGWNPARVVAAILVESLLLAAAGSLLGIGFGLFGLRLMILHPQIGSFLQPQVTTTLVVQSVALILAVGALGGLYPAWRATRFRPMELLRGE